MSLPIPPSLLSSPPSPTTPPSLHPRLLTLEVRGGYLDGTRLSFADHTTCIIGGKGSGKTTLFEELRFALGASSLAPKDSVRSLLKKNLGAGTVRIEVETEHGVRYVYERGLADERPRVMTPDGAVAKVAPELFRIEAYGQDEIERVGESRASQLALLDRLAGAELAPIVAEIADVQVALADSGAKLLAIEAEATALESDASEARAIEEQLRPLIEGTGPDAALLQRAHVAKGLRTREKQAVLGASGAIDEARRAVEALVATHRKKLAAVLPREVRDGTNADLFRAIEAELVGVSGALEDLGLHAARRVSSASSALAGLTMRLGEEHARQEGEYEALQARQKEDQARSDARTRLQDRHAAVAGAPAALDEKAREHGRLRHERVRLVARLRELCKARYARRARVVAMICAQLEADGVRVKLAQNAQDDAFRALLREAFQEITSGQPKWLVERIARIRPDDLVAIVRRQAVNELVEKAELQKYPDRAAQVIAALTPSARLYTLEAAAFDDETTIEVRHGEVWKDTVECSPGQRSGAILPILLLGGSWPLLVDQPDDNVDPDFMCNAILPRIAALEGARQFVFVSHHANVPVLTMAQQVAMIGSNGKTAGVHAEGEVARMTSWIVCKLEGGEGAFETRRRTYESSAPGSHRKVDGGKKE